MFCFNHNQGLCKFVILLFYTVLKFDNYNKHLFLFLNLMTDFL